MLDFNPTPSKQAPERTRAFAWPRYLADESGNFLVLFALFIPVLLLALGASNDYISATRREDTINGIADAAALAATTPAMMLDSCNPDQTAGTCAPVLAQVTAVFTSQLAAVQGVGTVTPTITITDTSTTPVKRVATVGWTSTSNNNFGGILGMPTITIGGGAQAKNSSSPVTTFYMLIDESPSMAFPAQSTGVTSMKFATPNNSISGAGGCALSCHEYQKTDAGLESPAGIVCNAGSGTLSGGVFPDGSTQFPCVLTDGTISGTTDGKPYKGLSCKKPTRAQNIGVAQAYGAEDAFALGRCLAVQLRVDLVNQAVASLMTVAPATAIENNTTYAVDIYTMDLGDNNVPSPFTRANPTPSVPTIIKTGLQNPFTWPTPTNSIVFQTQAQMNSGFASATTAANAIAPLETKAPGNDDYSYIDQEGLAKMYGIMPTPGTGGTSVGDTPKEVLFIVTDGMNDIDTGYAGAPYNCAVSQGLHCYYNRPVFAVNSTKNGATSNDYCTDIKAKGIRIAFLYLRYNPLDPYADYIGDIEPFQYPSGEGGVDTVEQAAINCASSGLEFTVDTGTDINTAMNALFQKAVQTAYLAH